jgi:methyltransferase
MMASITLFAPNSFAMLLLAFVTLQRLLELILARNNTEALVARGAVEHAPGHYPLIVALHSAWLVGLWLLAGGIAPDPAYALVYAVVQGLRLWTLLTLGSRWTTRIIIIPGERLVASGPYRLIKHPNYCVVAAEIFILPLCFGLTVYALAFSLLNAAVLAVRIQAENEALSLSERP